MKTSKRNKLFGLALAGSFSLFGATNASAAAGDTISNFATLQYSVGTTPQTVIESGDGLGNSVPGAGYATANNLTTDFVEDRVVNFTVVEQEGITVNVAPSATVQVQRFDVTNSGNGTHDFIFTALDRTTGTADPYGGINDNFDVTSSQVFVDTVLDGIYVPADDTAIFADEVAAGATVRVFIVSTIPDSVTVSDGDLAVMALVTQVAAGGAASPDDSIAANAGAAITNDDNNNTSPAGTYNNGATAVLAGSANDIVDDPATEQIVFNDPAGTVDSTNALDVVQNGQASDDSSYTVVTAALTVAKSSAALWDFVNLNDNPKSIPGGSVIRYTISVANAAGAADASLTSIVDDLALSIDTQFGDGTAANAAVSGANNVRITDGAGTVVFCEADANDATTVDGCDSTLGGVADRLSVDLTAVVGITNVLAAGQTLTIEFDVILP